MVRTVCSIGYFLGVLVFLGAISKVLSFLTRASISCLSMNVSPSSLYLVRMPALKRL